MQMGTANRVDADDAMDKETAISQEKQEVADRYYRLSGKQAEYTNLIQSLEHVNARGERASEIIAALDMIYLTGQTNENLADSISKCYRNNSHWLVKVKCIESLWLFEEELADKYAHEMLNNPDIGLEPKLSVARKTLKRGKLFGYSVLFEGLISSNKFERRRAEELKREFEKYDGQVYDEKTKKKIAIPQLIEKVKEIEAVHK